MIRMQTFELQFFVVDEVSDWLLSKDIKFLKSFTILSLYNFCLLQVNVFAQYHDFPAQSPV